jgi:hypothetical protein
LQPNRSRELASELRPAADPVLSRPASAMSMGPRTSAQHAVLSASATRPSSSFGSQQVHADLTKGVSFHMMSSAAEALIQQAAVRVSAPHNLDSGIGPGSTTIWTPSSSKVNASACKVPRFHAPRSGWDKLNMRPPSSLFPPNKGLPNLHVNALLHSSPLNSPRNLQYGSDNVPAV